MPIHRDITKITQQNQAYWWFVRNPANPTSWGWYFIPLFTGFYTSQVLIAGFLNHQQYQRNHACIKTWCWLFPCKSLINEFYHPITMQSCTFEVPIIVCLQCGKVAWHSIYILHLLIFFVINFFLHLAQLVVNGQAVPVEVLVGWKISGEGLRY